MCISLAKALLYYADMNKLSPIVCNSLKMYTICKVMIVYLACFAHIIIELIAYIVCVYIHV